MKKTVGRTPKFSYEVLRIIAEKTTAGDLTQRKAARFYKVSHGLISASKLKFKDQIAKPIDPPKSQHLTSKELETRKSVQLEIESMINTLTELEKEIRAVQTYHQKLFLK